MREYERPPSIMAKCGCENRTPILPENLEQCQGCGAIWQKGKPDKHPLARSPFRVGQVASDVLRICRRTGRYLIRKPIPLNHQNDDDITKLTAPDLRVQWDLSDGISLRFSKAPKSPFHIYAIVLREV